jgi:phosphoribosylanthranilate isomerase
MWVKICGIRDTATAENVAKLMPDAIGLNFYSQTPRAVSVVTAAEIVRQLPPKIEPVGLFVNHAVEEIRSICDQCNIRTVQLHGDEPPQLLADLQADTVDLKIIRAYRMGTEGLDPLEKYLADCARLNAKIFACLIDARIEGLYGGSGRTVPWNRLDAEYQPNAWPRMILAGGLTPKNVSKAVGTVRPWGVDVAGGVESSPGEKDLNLIERFITTAREASTEVN